MKKTKGFLALCAALTVLLAGCGDSGTSNSSSVAPSSGESSAGSVQPSGESSSETVS